MDNLFRPGADRTDYLLATYQVTTTTDLNEAALAIAIGQSIGNPTVRSPLETSDLIGRHGCVIFATRDQLANRISGEINIGFPIVNLGPSDGVSQLMAQVMGGHLEIGSITSCRLTRLRFPPAYRKIFRGPAHGITGIRARTGRPTGPILGGIIKPKIGLAIGQLLDVIKRLVDGGIDFIKDDEIMADPKCCSVWERAQVVGEWLADNAPGVIYAVCVTADPAALAGRIDVVRQGGSAVHFNWWTGLGAYKDARDANTGLFLFMQKSGLTALINPHNPFGIDEEVILDLAARCGVDFAHVGMSGGYLDEPAARLYAKIKVLRDHGVMPSLSCGLHPGLVTKLVSDFGEDVMLTAGGAIHGHPGGITAGVRAFRQAISGEPGPDYLAAVARWGEAPTPSGNLNS